MEVAVNNERDTRIHFLPHIFQYTCCISSSSDKISASILGAGNINKSNLFTGEILAIGDSLSFEVKIVAHPGSETLHTSLNAIRFHKQKLLLPLQNKDPGSCLSVPILVEPTIRVQRQNK